ncbi:MAG: Ppx/GppA phosphatase family protein [Thermomicrobiales bacterium]
MSGVAAGEDGAPAIVAAFDIGSNSIKMTVARRTGEGLEEFDWRSETVRLGQGIEGSNRLADDRVAAALDTLSRFSRIARDAGAGRLIGVATEATRVAANGAEFLDRVRLLTGIEVQSISGDREVDLTFKGLDGVVDLDGESVVADIGGGSTEIILASERKVTWAASIALGSGRLADRFLRSDPPTIAEMAQCREAAAGALAEVPFGQRANLRLVIVGGTGEYLFRLLPPSSPGTPEALDTVASRLATMTAAELSTHLEIPLARAKVLPAGLEIARAVASLAGPTVVQAAKSGIRRGLLLAAFAGEL